METKALKKQLGAAIAMVLVAAIALEPSAFSLAEGRFLLNSY